MKAKGREILGRQWLTVLLNCQVRSVKGILWVWGHGEVIGDLGCPGVVRNKPDRSESSEQELRRWN